MWNSVQMKETSIFEVLHLGTCFFLCNFNRASNSFLFARFTLIGVLSSQPRNLTAAQNLSCILEQPAIRTIAKIKEIKAVIVQMFQDGSHSDDITMRQHSLLNFW